MRKLKIDGHIQAGGSCECIFVMLLRSLAVCLLLVAVSGCSVTDAEPPTNSVYVAISGVSPSVGQVYSNAHQDAAFTVGGYLPDDPVLTGGIRINGSTQFQVSIDMGEFTEKIANNPDWTLEEYHVQRVFR